MKILIISLAGVGDTLFAIPLTRHKEEPPPKSEIEVLVMWESSAAVLRNNPDIDKAKTNPGRLLKRRVRVERPVALAPPG